MKVLDGPVRLWPLNWTTLVLLLAALIAVSMTPAPARAQEDAGNVTLSDIDDNPEAYLGRVVTVRGDLTEVMGPGSFVLNDQSILDLDSLLVIGANSQVIPTGTAFERGVGAIDLQVTGTVRNFVLADIERDFDLDLQDDLYVDYESEPVLVARNVEALATLSEIDDNPDVYLGLPVTIYGDLVDVISSRVFRLDDQALLDRDNLLVMGARDSVIPAGRNIFEPEVFDSVSPRTAVDVLVHGTVRSFVLVDIERDFDLDLQDDLYVDYENEPVLVADWVQVVASLSEVEDNPATYAGLTLTVRGDIVDTVAANAFELDDPQLLGGDTLLVISRDRNYVAPVDGTVQVTGAVVIFDTVAIEDDLGYDLGDAFTPYGGQVAILASSITPITE